MNADQAVLLSARDLSVRFGGVLAVNKVSFDVQRGEVFTLIGPNGAGKTTVFNLISRIYTPTTGELTFEGRRLNDLPPHKVAELGIARTVVHLTAGQSADAVNEADRLSQRAPGVANVRHFAAVACLTLARQEGTPEGTAQALRAKAASHLEWLLKNAPEDGRRDAWTRLLGR